MKVNPSRCKKLEFSSTRRKKTNLSTACSIDDLPDEVLISILSRLTLVEAVRTSILSHRWINLWRFTSGNLVLKLEERNAGDSSQLLKFLLVDRVKRWTEGVQFVNMVNRIMDLHLGPSINELIIHYGSLGCIFPDPICHCIHFALQKEVKVLELAAFGHPFPDLEKFLTISKGIELKTSFLSLTSFRLVNISIKEEMVEYLLSNCPQLEQLSLKGAKDLWSLNVVSPSLKFLTIWSFQGLKRLTISAVNLVSLEYLGFPTLPSFEFMRFSAVFSTSYMNNSCTMSNPYVGTEFCFENAPNLSEITSDINYFQGLVNKRHSNEPLKKLTLRFNSQVINRPFYTSPRYQVLPRFRCLKQLELELSVLPGASLLFWVFCAMACPLLSTFYVQFYEETTSWAAWDRSTVFFKLPSHRKRVEKQLKSYRHKHLKQVKLMDVVDETNYIEFAVDLLRISKSLEKLIIKPRSDRHRIAIVEDYAKLLDANLPLGAELVIQ